MGGLSRWNAGGVRVGGRADDAGGDDPAVAGARGQALPASVRHRQVPHAHQLQRAVPVGGPLRRRRDGHLHRQGEWLVTRTRAPRTRLLPLTRHNQT